MTSVIKISDIPSDCGWNPIETNSLVCNLILSLVQQSDLMHVPLSLTISWGTAGSGTMAADNECKFCCIDDLNSEDSMGSFAEMVHKDFNAISASQQFWHVCNIVYPNLLQAASCNWVWIWPVCHVRSPWSILHTHPAACCVVICCFPLPYNENMLSRHNLNISCFEMPFHHRVICISDDCIRWGCQNVDPMWHVVVIFMVLHMKVYVKQAVVYRQMVGVSAFLSFSSWSRCPRLEFMVILRLNYVYCIISPALILHFSRDF